MKKLTEKNRINIIFAIFIILLLTPSIRKYVASNSYYPDMRAAAANKETKAKLIGEITTVIGQEGVVYIGLDEYGSISAYCFDTRNSNGKIQYQVASEESLPYVEDCMVKMNTAPESTEQIAIGIGEASAKKYAKDTGIDVEFVTFEYADVQCGMWYIISAEGLGSLPYALLQGFEVQPPSAMDAYVILIGIIVIIIILIFFYKEIKKRKYQPKQEQS